MTSRKLAASITAAFVLTAAFVSLLFFLPGAPGPRPDDTPEREAGTAGDGAGKRDEEAGARGATEPEAAEALPGGEAVVDEAAEADEVSAGEGPVSLSGTVTDTRGEAIEDARVAVSRVEEWSSVLRQATGRFENPPEALRWVERQYQEFAERSPSTRTGADGTYAFRGLGAGEYRVLVSHREHVPETDARALVSAGEEARCDVELAPGRIMTHHHGSGDQNDDGSRCSAPGTLHGSIVRCRADRGRGRSRIRLAV